MKLLKRPQNAELNEAALAEVAAVGRALRAELDMAAGQPAYFWTRQQARVRARLAAKRTSLRWAIAAMMALVALSLALLNLKSSTPAPPATAQTADSDDLLLKDIQYSLAQRAPEPLMPASILVQEMTSNANNDQGRED